MRHLFPRINIKANSLWIIDFTKNIFYKMKNIIYQNVGMETKVVSVLLPYIDFFSETTERRFNDITQI